MKEYINEVTSIELVLRDIKKRFQMSFKIHLIDVRFQKRSLGEEKLAFYRCEISSQYL